MHFVILRRIWDSLVALLGAKQAELVHKFVPRSWVRIFWNKRNRSAPHWTLNSCFCAFHTIWVHLGLFGCVTTLSLKRVKLVQKFGTRSRVRIFRNEHTRSSPLDPKLIVLYISYYFSAVGTVWLARKTWWKIGRTGVNVRATKSHWNFSQRTHLIHPIGP